MSLISFGLALGVIGIAGRYVMKQYKLKPLPTLFKNYNKHYRGGFDAKMSKREACLILGISQNASKDKIRNAHKRIMISNHPDRNGSLYLASKINEAKEMLKI
ncbi:Mitochondrial import inner membrane translocase subunit TIM14 [Intoshia linei]|uniref:Mitochondrial import inner membrane translocase subunit TIM14 n=1 Tax=Intoshia linei TaxID=1819745 RepID=A0A177AZ68_9BILA|nr:Mitochondrial import inner membrane translocase subunit TIM14 [Intoshia linei]